MERARRRAARAAFCGAQRFWRQFPRAARLLRARSRRPPAPLSPPPPPASVRLRPPPPAQPGSAWSCCPRRPSRSSFGMFLAPSHPVGLSLWTERPTLSAWLFFTCCLHPPLTWDSFWPVQFPSISGSLAPHSLCFSASVSSLKPPVPFSLCHSLSSSSPHPSIRVRGLKERLEVVVTSA